MAPELTNQNIVGAAVWYDFVAWDADRLTFSWAVSASEHEATLANYVEATGLVAEQGRVAGALAIDRVTGDPLRIPANAVVNATGARLNHLLQPFAASVVLPLLQAMNVVTTREAPKSAVGGRSRSGRHLFLVPWHGRALFGTWESSVLCDSSRTGVDNAALEAFLAELNDAFPSYRLRRDEVSLVHRGVVPARMQSNTTPTLEGHDCVFEHRAEGLAGLVSVAGTKYTTARGVAERIVDRVCALLQRSTPPSVSASRPLPHVALDNDALLHHVAEHEMVLTLADAVLRRTRLGALGCPDAATLTHAASIVGNVLRWSPARQTDEIAAVRALY